MRDAEVSSIRFDPFIAGAARALASLRPSLFRLMEDDGVKAAARAAASRGYFDPEEEQQLAEAFGITLTARAALLEIIAEAREHMAARQGEQSADAYLRCFAIGYAAACMLVCAARYLVADLATDRIVQRKLNEGSPAHRVPRKQYTRIYRSLTHPLNAWRLLDAMRFADEHREQLETLRGDATMRPVIETLDACELSIRLDAGNYVKARLRYRWHSWRRRNASGTQQALFHVAEAFGRLIAEMRLQRPPRITPKIRRAFGELLQPGDVIITRHNHAMSNLFLPGFWPHVALHIGPASVRELLKIQVDPERVGRWVDPVRILEAKKDGVLLRPLKETLRVDAAAIIRPTLDAADIAHGISRALEHEGKLYNFDFDFFRSDRLVCTEVVYRGFHGVGPIEFQLTRRSGRPTLSAEDLISHALDARGYTPVAAFNTPHCPNQLITGDDVSEQLRLSLQRDRPGAAAERRPLKVSAV